MKLFRVAATAVILAGCAAVGTGEDKKVASPLTVKMKSADYVKLTNGKLNGQIAFMTGKLKLSGQVALVMKLQKIFPPKKK